MTKEKMKDKIYLVSDVLQNDVLRPDRVNYVTVSVSENERTLCYQNKPNLRLNAQPVEDEFICKDEFCKFTNTPSRTGIYVWKEEDAKWVEHAGA